MRPAAVRSRFKEEHGAALLIVLTASTLLIGLGGGLVLLTTTEANVAAHFRSGVETLYAADAALERALPDLNSADWDAVLRGAQRSTFVDGDPTGTRPLADGTLLDLVVATNLEGCGLARPCSETELIASTSERPYGANNPRWQLYAYGPIAALASSGGPMPPNAMPPIYVVVWVGDDPLENDGDPFQDGSGEANPGREVLSLRARAYGGRGTRRLVEAVIARTPSGLRVLSWGEQ